MTTYASPPTTARREPEPGSHAVAAIVAMMLGILVAVLGFFALLMWVDAHKARNDANRAADKVARGGTSFVSARASSASRSSR